MTPPVTFQLGLDDLRALRDRKPMARRAPYVGLAFVVVYAVLAVLSWSLLSTEAGRADPDRSALMTDSLLFGFMTLVPVLLLFGLAMRAGTLRRTFAGSIMARGPITLRADTDALHAEQIGSRGTYPWSVFTSIEVTAGHIFLFLSPLQPLIVPRAAVEGSELGRCLLERGGTVLCAGRDGD